MPWLLAKVTVSENGNDITFSGVNVHIVDGSGDTWGDVNGLGNLIVGYNELRGIGYVDDRTGSHNIVVGVAQNYSVYGGLVAGVWNTISGEYASVSGGGYNIANGWHSSVTGGSNNTSIGAFSSISGGEHNTANTANASVSGGTYNIASAVFSSVSGGSSNTANGVAASVSGGSYNVASGNYSSVSGGGGDTAEYGNEAFANYSAVLGGERNIAGAPNLIDHAIGENSSISGGANNEARGTNANW